MEKLEISAEWKMQQLKELIEGCMNGQASEAKLHPSGVIGAIAELNKMQGHYAPEKREITHDGPTKATELTNEYERDY